MPAKRHLVVLQNLDELPPQVVCQRIYSPYQTADEGLWVMEIAFTDVTSSQKTLHLVTEAWGLLPQLRLGTLYVNKSVRSDDMRHRGATIEVAVQTDTIALRQAGTLFNTRSDFKDLFACDLPQDLAEWFYTVTSDKGVLYIPAIVMLSALLCPYRELALGILTNNYLDGLLNKALKVQNRTLRLSFDAQVPKHLLRRKHFVVHVARLLTDFTFRNAWQSLLMYRLSDWNKQVGNSYVPLRFDLPELNPKWRLRVIKHPHRDAFLVLSIAEVTPLRALEFDKIVYSHPDIWQSEISVDSSSSSVISVPAQHKLVINNTMRPASTAGNSRRIVGEPTPLQEIQKVRVYTNRRSANPIVVQTPTIDPSAKIPAAVVSLHESRFGGDLPVAEFSYPTKQSNAHRIVDQSEKIAPSLSEKQQALNAIASKLTALTINIYEITPTQSLPFTFGTGGNGRQFLLAKLDFGDGDNVWLLEFDLFDNHQLSSLFFSAAGLSSFEKGLLQVDAIVLKALSPAGHWKSAGLTTLAQSGLRVKRFPHRSEIELWGTKILAAAKTFVRSNLADTSLGDEPLNGRPDEQ